MMFSMRIAPQKYRNTPSGTFQGENQPIYAKTPGHCARILFNGAKIRPRKTKGMPLARHPSVHYLLRDQ